MSWGFFWFGWEFKLITDNVDGRMHMHGLFEKKNGELTYIYVHWKKYGQLTLSSLSSI